MAWLVLVLGLPTLSFIVISCSKKKTTTNKSTPSMTTRSDASVVMKPVNKTDETKKTEKSMASDVDAKTPSAAGESKNIVQTTPAPVKTTEQKPAAPVMKSDKASVEPTQPSSKSARKSTKHQLPPRSRRSKMSKEKMQTAEENQQKPPPSSAEDSDTFKHVMSIRDVVKKDKAMKEKQQKPE